MRSAAPGPAPMKCTVMTRSLRGGERAGRRADHQPRTDQARRRAGGGQRRGFGDRRHADQREHALGAGFGAVACGFQFGVRHQHDGDAELCRRRFDAGLVAASPRSWQCTSSASAAIPARASAARIAASISGAAVPRLQPTPATIMALSIAHCVTGIAARQPVFSPTASGARNRNADQFAAKRGMARRAAALRSRASPH